MMPALLHNLQKSRELYLTLQENESHALAVGNSCRSLTSASASACAERQDGSTVPRYIKACSTPQVAHYMQGASGQGHAGMAIMLHNLLHTVRQYRVLSC